MKFRGVRDQDNGIDENNSRSIAVFRKQCTMNSGLNILLNRAAKPQYFYKTFIVVVAD